MSRKVFFTMSSGGASGGTNAIPMKAEGDKKKHHEYRAAFAPSAGP
jgi:hypothetical protein